MPQYRINKDGSKTTLSKYSRKGIYTLNKIFPEDPATALKYLKKRKKYKNTNLQKTYGIHDNSALVRKIFTRFLTKVLARVSAGDLFIVPGQTNANISLKKIPTNEVKKLRQKGFYADYDIVKAGFNIPKFVYDFGPFSARRDIGIYVPPQMQKYALKQAENQLISWSYIPKTFNRDVQDE